MSLSGDIVITNMVTQPYLYCFIKEYFLVKFHFFDNNKSYILDFFTVSTIDIGLSIDGIGSVVAFSIL
jgi:hypothetical protein